MAEQAYVVWWDGGYRRFANQDEALDFMLEQKAAGKKNVRMRKAA